MAERMARSASEQRRADGEAEEQAKRAGKRYIRPKSKTAPGNWSTYAPRTHGFALYCWNLRSTKLIEATARRRKGIERTRYRGRKRPR
jgi:hypothetical protein